MCTQRSGSELRGLAVPTLPAAWLCPSLRQVSSVRQRELPGTVVICSWLTDCHQLGLKQHAFPLSGSVGNQCVAGLSSLAQGLTGSQSRCQLGLGSHLKAGLRKDPLPGSCCWQDLVS